MDDQEPLVVEGPDGTEYEFPAGTPIETAVAHVRRISAQHSAPAGDASSSVSTGMGLRAAVSAMFPGAFADTSPKALEHAAHNQMDAVTGAGKGLLHTVTTTGNLLRKVPGIKQLDEAIGSVELPKNSVVPTNAAQKLGYGAEQIAETMVPAVKAAGTVATVTKGAPAIARLGAQMATGAATNVGTGVMQGHDNLERDAIVGAAGPLVGGALSGAARYVGSKAVPWVKSALKTPMSILKRDAGFGRQGADAVDTRIAKTVVDERLFNEDVATDAINQSMGNVDAKLAAKATVPTDAPPRAERYLNAQSRGAAKSPLAEGPQAAIEAKKAEMVRGRFGEDVTTMVPAPSKVLGPNGKPVMSMVPQTTRQLRATAPVSETREATLAMSKYSPSRWGGTQNAPEEATKAVERATRDAVKRAVPETRPDFARAARIIKAREPLRLAAKRDASRDVNSLHQTAGDLAGVASGNPAPVVLGRAMRWFKNNQLKAGIYAGDLQRALDAGDVATVGRIFQKLGVTLASDDIPREGSMTIKGGG